MILLRRICHDCDANLTYSNKSAAECNQCQLENEKTYNEVRQKIPAKMLVAWHTILTTPHWTMPWPAEAGGRGFAPTTFWQREEKEV